jgi:UDP-3-O-[3-hydroxymyristoyl] N-acetylglucosamine deacetylase
MIHFNPADADTGVVFVTNEGVRIEGARFGSRRDRPFDTNRRPQWAACRHDRAFDGCACSAWASTMSTIEIEGNEVPILDGSAGMFVDAFEQGGIESLDVKRRYHPCPQAGAHRQWRVLGRVPAL